MFGFVAEFKELGMMSTVRAFMLVMLISSTCAAEPVLEAHQLSFKGVLAYRAGDKTVYSLMGLGFIRAPRTDDVDHLISVWLADHPRALVTPVDTGMLIGRPGSVAGRSGASLQYIWIEDGNDNLGEFLVRKGALLAGVMADPASVENLNKIPAEPWQTPPTRLVTDESYNAFLARVGEAEASAKNNKQGLWSAQYDDIMQRN